MSDFDRLSSCPDGPVSESFCSQLAEEDGGELPCSCPLAADEGVLFCGQFVAEEDELSCIHLATEDEDEDSLYALRAERDHLTALLQQQTESVDGAMRELRELRAHKAVAESHSKSLTDAVSALHRRLVLQEEECVELTEAFDQLEAEHQELHAAFDELEGEFTRKDEECAELIETLKLRDSELKGMGQEARQRFYLGGVLLLLLLAVYMFPPVADSGSRWTPFNRSLRVVSDSVWPVLFLPSRGSTVCTDLIVVPVLMPVSAMPLFFRLREVCTDLVVVPVAVAVAVPVPAPVPVSVMLLFSHLREVSAFTWTLGTWPAPMLLLSPRGPEVCTDLVVVPPRRYPVCSVMPQCPMRRMPRVVGACRLGLTAVRQPQRVRTALDAMPLVLEKRVGEVIPEAVLPEAAPPEERGSSTVLVPALRLGVTALGLYAWHLHMLTYAAGALVLRTRIIPGYHR